jgi:hypothetical protein
MFLVGINFISIIDCSSGYYLVCMLDMLDSSMFSLTKQSEPLNEDQYGLEKH